MKLLILLAIPVGLTGCQTAFLHDDGNLTRPDGSSIIYVDENHGAFDANPGDQVNVIMYEDGNDVTIRCENMGGKIMTVNGIKICFEVDF